MSAMGGGIIRNSIFCGCLCIHEYMYAITVSADLSILVF